MSHPSSRNGVYRKIRKNQILCELLPTGDHLARLIKNHTVAVKHQFILSADHIGVRQNGSVLRR